MKRSINIISLAIIVLAAGIFLYLVYSPETASANVAFSGFPLNQPRVISFDVNKEVLEDKSKREKLDQVRDWLLYAVVSDSGQSLEQLGGEILFDLPATRDRYMRQIGNFEYGETRSRIIKEGEVVALLPADGSERIDQLAHIADEHRKNAGDVLKTIMVFDYKLNVDGENINSGEITRREVIDGKELFTAKYGYYESRIGSVEDLKQFLAQVDDVVFAQQDDDALKLGGRKILGHPYRSLGVQDVAAIWQSEDKIRRGEKSVDGSGFSLDPAYNFVKLKEVFDTEVVPVFEPPSYGLEDLGLESLFKEPWMSKYRFKAPNNYRDQVKTGFDRCDIGPFFAYLDSFRSTRREDVEYFELLFTVGHLTKAQRSEFGIPDRVAEAFTTNQQARYDGDLEGTEVGMVLFYTDLVAKLWGFDYKHTTPTQIQDFKSGLDWARRQSPAFPRDKMQRGRLWFGPDDRGYQAADGGRLAFARKATRLFAKTSNHISQRDEVEAWPSLASFIGWWDDHFEEIARYEPEYERLNQIMKWSLLISWLNQSDKSGYLAFLKQIAVDHKHRFPEWVKRQPDLKFNQWEEGMFLKTPGPCTGTEMLPEFSSEKYVPLGKKPGDKYSLSGGVSLSTKTLFKERTFLTAKSEIATVARRSSLNYDPRVFTRNSLKTLEGTAYEFQKVATNRFTVTSTPRVQAQLRTTYGDLASSKFQNVLANESGALKVVTKYGDTQIGNLSISRTSNGFKVGWESRELDLSQSLARKLSDSAVPDKVLTNNPLVESALKLPGDEGYLLKLRDSEQWTRMSVQNKVSGPLESGWQARVADQTASSKPLNIAFWDQAKVNGRLAEGDYLVMTTQEAGSSGSVLTVTREAPLSGGSRVTILSGDQKIVAVVDRNSNSLFVKYGELPEAYKNNPGQLQKAISRVDLKQIPRDGVLNLPETRVLTQQSLGRELASGDYQGLTRQLTRSPQEFKTALENHLNQVLKQSDDLIARGDYTTVKNTLDNLIEVYGPRSELTIRRGVAQIRNGETASAARTLNETIIQSPGVSRDALFREVNSRLRNGPDSLDTLVQLADNGTTTTAVCEVKTLTGPTRAGADIPLDSAILYVEKSPRLNNLDWNTNIQASLKEVISGEFGEVIKLPPGSLNKFRPTEIYAADIGKRFDVVRQTTTQYNFRFPVTAQPGSRCQDDFDASKGCGEIYIVREKSRR